MYPDWPESGADLVPLPLCDGPKLKPFDFQGPQNIEFLERLGEGLHSFVFKVKILSQIYALKIFDFVSESCWDSPSHHHWHYSDVAASAPFRNHSDPFACECRAFGRLQETGYEDLSIKCFGYLLLDEEHEHTVRERFNFCLEYDSEIRQMFVGKSGKLPPYRGVLKEYGQVGGDLRKKGARRILGDIIRYHQLGILQLDVGQPNLINGKVSDFSQAITSPHFRTSPELHSHLTPEWLSALEIDTFRHAMSDYWMFDEMVREWNEEHENPKDKVLVHAFPSGNGCRIKYNLRSTPSRERVYTLVDPRLYDWKATADGAKSSATDCRPGRSNERAADGQKPGRKGRPSQGRRRGSTRGTDSNIRRRLDPKPPRWYLACERKVAAKLKAATNPSTLIQFFMKDGLIYPCRFQGHGPEAGPLQCEATKVDKDQPDI